jgi:hypothetical protein
MFRYFGGERSSIIYIVDEMVYEFVCVLPSGTKTSQQTLKVVPLGNAYTKVRGEHSGGPLGKRLGIE